MRSMCVGRDAIGHSQDVAIYTDDVFAAKVDFSWLSAIL
jgi:hypothetical protein